MRTELSDGEVTIRAYMPGIEMQILEAARESLAEIGPVMRTWRDGATLEIAERHVAETIDAWHRGDWFDFAITCGDVLLGRIGLDDLRSDGTANVGYWVRTSQTRRGYATAAVRLVSQFGFEDLRLERLELSMPHDHLASRRVAEKAGATFEGVDAAGSCTYALARRTGAAPRPA
jgi:ribosomal-protein-serine acetyltransferase